MKLEDSLQMSFLSSKTCRFLEVLLLQWVAI